MFVGLIWFFQALQSFACKLLWVWVCHVWVSEWLHTLVCLNVKELLSRSRRHVWSLSDSNEIRRHNQLVRKRTLNHLAKLVYYYFLDDWAVLWVLTFRMHLTVYYYHVTYQFQSESTLYSLPECQELLSRSRRLIWSLSDSNETVECSFTNKVVVGVESPCCHKVLRKLLDKYFGWIPSLSCISGIHGMNSLDWRVFKWYISGGWAFLKLFSGGAIF